VNQAENRFYREPGTELEPYQQLMVAPRDVIDGWVDVISDITKLAGVIEQTDFVPKTLRGKPAAITAAILAGREVGIPPMRALQHMHMVDGRPTMSAEQKRAQALAAGHHIVYLETTTERCVVKGRRAGDDEWTTVTFTMDDAKRGALAGKDNYRKWPRRMLQARATGELCDLLFPDATGGLTTTEQAWDETDAATAASNGQVEPKRTARRKTAVASPPVVTQSPQDTAIAAPELPPLPGEDGYDWPEVEQPPADDGQPISGDQMKKMHAVFGQLKIRDREERLALTKAIVNRELSSANELSRDEASALIDVLEQATRQADPVKWLGTIVLRPDGEVE
jgi:hypothetical protein